MTRNIMPQYRASGTGLSANGVSHTIGLPKAHPIRFVKRGGPVQRGLGATKATNVQTAAQSLHS